MGESGTQEVAALHVRVASATREAERRSERVVVEEPLETRLDGRSVAVTMRTPGHDTELSVGFLLSEGVVEHADAIATAAHCDETENVVDVRTAPGAQGIHAPSTRHFYATSSCGVCGKASIDEVRSRVRDLSADAARIGAAKLVTLPERMRAAQPLFSDTGALHAAALFTPEGALVCLREDVGRHNAVDKVIGWAALRRRLPLEGHVLLVSGRSGFEIVQKAVIARIPILAGISGTSSLALALAEECGMTLVAFLRGTEMNVMTHPGRIP